MTLPTSPHQPQPLRLTLPLPGGPTLQLTLIEPIAASETPRWQLLLVNQSVERPLRGDVQLDDRLSDGQQRFASWADLTALSELIEEAKVARLAYDRACRALLAFLAGREEAT